MHGKRHEHPEVFKARMAFHKSNKQADKQADKDDTKDKGRSVPQKDEANDTAQTSKRHLKVVHKEKAHEQHEQKKPARGVLTHLLPNQ